MKADEWPATAATAQRKHSRVRLWLWRHLGLFCLTFCLSFIATHVWHHRPILLGSSHDSRHEEPGHPATMVTSPSVSPYGAFPVPGDKFRFIPCTNITVLPQLDAVDPASEWSSLFDPNPDHWSWGNDTQSNTSSHHGAYDPYAGRGIYLCGYLDVPLDYTNKSDPRIVRLAVTKFQVSGLAPWGAPASRSGQKSERTIIIEPGGPGGSGTRMAWGSAEKITKKYSEGTFDVLGWDPRGVNASLPAVSCFPFDADRDRWSLISSQSYATSASPRSQLEFGDAMHAAIFNACKERHGDLARFVSTAFVARDVEEIRKALDEDEVTGYFVSYGTGIGQTYASMFPNSIGRLILDGTEYVRDHRELGGFGWTALDNTTDAWNDGFLGECLKAGPEHCALATPLHGKKVVLADLQARMKDLLQSLALRPVTGYTARSGPSLVTYFEVISLAYAAMYSPKAWPSTAQMLFELEQGNSTLATEYLDVQAWEYDPTSPITPPRKPRTDELGDLVICSDSYDAPQPDGLDWWEELWSNMTTQSWIAGDSRFFNVFPCRQFNNYWGPPAEVYRGDLNHTLKHPVMLIAETYDPATPLRNGRRLLHEMGRNARLIVHHGYGHSSQDTSACTDALARAYIMHGKLPTDAETDCYADEKPYLQGRSSSTAFALADSLAWDPIREWSEHVSEMRTMGFL